MSGDSPSESDSTAPKAAKAFGGLSPAEAAKRRWEKQRERDAQAGDAARAPSRSPMDALRSMLAQNPEKYAAGLASLIEKGDPRSIQVIQTLFREEAEVKIPRAERLVRELDRDQRRALLLALEAKGLAQHLPAEPDPAPQAGPDEGHLATS